MASFHCAYCNTFNTLTESKYQVRKDHSKSGMLFCNSKCMGEGRKALRTLRLEGIPFHLVTTPLKKESGSFSGGVLANPQKMGGDEEKIKEKELGTVLDWQQENPMVNLMTLEIAVQDGGFFVKTGIGAPTTITAPAPPQVPPQAPPQPPQIPSAPQALPVGDTYAHLRNLGEAPTNLEDVQAWTKWAGSLDNMTPLSACDASNFMYLNDAQQDVSMKHCVWVPDFFSDARKTYGRYLHAQRDNQSGGLFIRTTTLERNGRPLEPMCYRCQGNGWISNRNLAWSFRFDQRTAVECEFCSNPHGIIYGLSWMDYLEGKLGTKQVPQILNDRFNPDGSPLHGMVNPIVLGKPGINYVIEKSMRQPIQSPSTPVQVQQVPVPNQEVEEPLPFIDIITDNPFPTS